MGGQQTPTSSSSNGFVNAPGGFNFLKWLWPTPRASNNQSTTKLYPALQGQAIVFEISKHWRSHCFQVNWWGVEQFV
jgi:hypothetical protein